MFQIITFLFACIFSIFVAFDAFAAPVVSVSLSGKCAKALKKKRGVYTQRKALADAASCTVKIKVKDSKTRKKLAGRRLRIYKNSGSADAGLASCYEPLSAEVITDRKGRATIRFPWDASACSLAVKDITDGTNGPAASLIQVSKFLSALHSGACAAGASTNSAQFMCSAVDYSGVYSFSSSDPGFESNDSDCRLFDGVMDITVTKVGTGYSATLGNGGIALDIERVTDQSFAAGIFIGRGTRFPQSYDFTLYPPAADSATISFSYRDMSINDIFGRNCNYTFSGVVQRQHGE